MQAILWEHVPEHVLEPRQVSNLMNAIKREGHDAVSALGGDIVSVIKKLQDLCAEDPLWLGHATVP